LEFTWGGRINHLGENVYILYVAEMAPNFRLLLLIYTLGNPGKRKISGCNLHFLRIAHYGKYCALFDLKDRPQHLVASPSFPKSQNL
jgi:hypothetical protein